MITKEEKQKLVDESAMEVIEIVKKYPAGTNSAQMLIEVYIAGIAKGLLKAKEIFNEK